MFEISISQIRNCVGDLEEQERKLNNLIGRMEEVCAGFDGFVADKSDKRALQAYLEQMHKERKDLITLKQTLSEIVHCYEETERKLVGGDVLPGVKNRFGMTDFGQVQQMLESLRIVFK